MQALAALPRDDQAHGAYAGPGCVTRYRYRPGRPVVRGVRGLGQHKQCRSLDPAAGGFYDRFYANISAGPCSARAGRAARGWRQLRTRSGVSLTVGHVKLW